jgi:hypothetical protein
MRKASTRLPEQGTQAPSPAPDLIPAKTENQLRTYPEIGPLNGGTSPVCQQHLPCRIMEGLPRGSGAIPEKRSPF